MAKELHLEAIESYKRAVEVNPRETWAWTSLGYGYFLNKQYSEAIDAFWVSFQGNARDSWPWKGLAESYHEEGDIVRSMAVYTQVIARLPTDYSLYISVGRLFMDSHMASDSFKMAVESCPL